MEPTPMEPEWVPWWRVKRSSETAGALGPAV
jgi:hypothetical protein